MTRKMKTEAGGLEIEDGTYRVSLGSLEDAEGEWEGKKRDLLKWNWLFPDVVGDDGEPGELSDLSSLALSPKSKLWARYQALTGVTLDLDMEIDLEDMVGKEAQAAIIHKPGKDGTGSWPRIENVIALPKTGKVKAAVSQADPYAGFRTEKAEIDWGKFKGEYEAKALTLSDIGKFLSVESVTPKGIRLWLEAGPDRSLAGLIADVSAVSGDEDVPFE
jgi:hypothetical protein